ncbi:hypothetical protein [uncultured Shewanella sp.]|uniref:hypothetical protein n=1 Tax=uncultured Shewanella sp. TaxID=173975 RepID=UPI002604652D|nr:hypothetical protein [uncultured Shewanella sp.]
MIFINKIKISIYEVLTLLMLFLSIIIPIVLNYQSNMDKMPKVEKTILIPSSPVSFLTENESISDDTRLVINGVEYDHMIIQDVYLENIGKVIIEPKDFIEAFTVTINPPYKILNVTTIDSKSAFNAKWSKVDDFTFSAEKFLFNPTEGIYFQVYITHKDPEAIKNRPADFTIDNYIFDTKVRIKGLAEFINHKSIHYSPVIGPLILDTPRIISIVLIASFILYCYLILLFKSQLLITYSNYYNYLCVVVMAVLAYLVSEITVYWLMGKTGVPKVHEPDRLSTILINGGVYSIHILFLILSFYRIRKIKRIKHTKNTAIYKLIHSENDI